MTKKKAAPIQHGKWEVTLTMFRAIKRRVDRLEIRMAHAEEELRAFRGGPPAVSPFDPAA